MKNSLEKAEAKALGQKYYMGTPCKYGHLGERFTSTGGCVSCSRINNAQDKAKEYRRQWVIKNPDRRRASANKWAAANRDSVRAYQQEYAARPNVKDRIVRNRRKRRGLPEPKRSCGEYCECCGRAFSETKQGAHLDHDHATDAFRGWLCFRCNAGIGLLGDNIDGLELAMEYLKNQVK